jgi:hypothetical protein
LNVLLHAFNVGLLPQEDCTAGRTGAIRGKGGVVQYDVMVTVGKGGEGLTSHFVRRVGGHDKVQCLVLSSREVHLLLEIVVDDDVEESLTLRCLHRRKTADLANRTSDTGENV